MALRTVRKIVHIDEEKCDGCGLCVPNCAEGAIRVVDGKARLMAENLCDGLGACLGHCPKGAITIEERAADAFDEEAVQRASAKEKPCGCPGAAPRAVKGAGLKHWPVQFMLLPEKGGVWEGADVLLAADCVGYAMPDFHESLLDGKTLAVACPKLDDAEFYLEKLTRVVKENDIRSVTVARMEVPCCGGLARVAELAVRNSGKDIPVKIVVVGLKGSVTG
jgi:NAD-dependent dihydropyrimidine dehydrogenase PreA subunit